jgi:hypothetical protein
MNKLIVGSKTHIRNCLKYCYGNVKELGKSKY